MSIWQVIFTKSEAYCLPLILVIAVMKEEEIKTSVTLKNLLRFCLISKKKLVLRVAILVFIFNMIELALPKILELYVKSYESEVVSFLGIELNILSTDAGKVIFLPAALAIMAVCRWIATYFKVYHQGKLGQSVLMEIRQKIYDKVQRFSFDYHDRQHSGILISNLVEDVRYANMFFDQALFLLMESVIFIFTVYLFIFWHAPLAALISALMLLCGYICALLILRHSFPIYGRTKELFAHKVALFTECMEGKLVINAYGQQDEMKKLYAQRVQDMHQSNLREIRWELLANQIVVWSTQLGIPALIFAYIFSQRNNNLEVSGGVIVLLFVTQVLILAKSRQLIHGTQLLVRFMITSRRLNEFFKESDEIDDNKGEKSLGAIESIEFDNVTFAYAQRDAVLSNFSFKFDNGKMLGVAGSTGAGKSSMVQLLAGFYETNKGRVLINGKPVAEYSENALRTGIAIVFQETFLFAGTVHENIAFGTPNATAEEVIWAAKMAYADEFIDKLKDGYDTEIGEKGISLSGGQKQRIGIARALLHKPRILILDSCTSALDTKTEKQILSSLNSLNGVVTIIISHRRSALESTDFLLVLDKGELVESGTPAVVCQPGSKYFKIMEASGG